MSSISSLGILRIYMLRAPFIFPYSYSLFTRVPCHCFYPPFEFVVSRRASCFNWYFFINFSNASIFIVFRIFCECIEKFAILLFAARTEHFKFKHHWKIGKETCIGFASN